MKKLLLITAVLALAGCQSSASRMAECEAQGISRDTCYLSEQNRKQGINAVAEKQAMENAANAVQHAQSAKAYKPGNLKPIHIKKNGIDFKRSADGFAYLNGSPMAKDEDNEYATAYSSGLFTVIVYKKNNRINAIEDGKDITRLR